MIRATFYSDNNDRFVAYEITGHAEAGPYGSDIVCAAVSAVSIGTSNNLERLLALTPEIESDNENGGSLKVSLAHLAKEDIQNPLTQLLLSNLYYNLQDISEQYTDYITINLKK